MSRPHFGQLESPTPGERLATWTMRVLLSLLFIVNGGTMAAGRPVYVATFARWGYVPALRFYVGTVVLLGGILLLVPRLARAATGLLCLVLLGAIATHIHAGEFFFLPIPFTVLALTIAYGWHQRLPPSAPMDEWRAAAPIR